MMKMRVKVMILSPQRGKNIFFYENCGAEDSVNYHDEEGKNDVQITVQYGE